MKAIASTDRGILSFARGNDEKKPFRVQANKIAWIKSQADQPGAKFDLTIFDGRGGIKFQRKDFGSETEVYGELANINTLLGEEVHVVVENIRGAEKVDIFVN